eukprot:SRR837773.5484.p1 GENE.SRR837773.5484~~SRR837773.5484.p1  ORF type:complete len:260 (-),score=21.77 SRR837773.5484:39-818(-)
MSCLVVSNGFRFEESGVQLKDEDRETLEREKGFFAGRAVPSANPPFFVPDHLAPRCHSCKVLFTVTVRRYHCRSCGLVLCGDCFKWCTSSLVALDERLRSRQLAAQSPAALGSRDEDRPVPRTMPGPKWQPTLQPGRSGTAPQPQDPDGMPDSPSRGGHVRSGDSDSDDEPPLAEELPAVAPPLSVVCPASASGPEPSLARGSQSRSSAQLMQGGLSRERGAFSTRSNAARMIRLCSSCTPFFEVGLGETYAMLQRRGV